MLAISLIMAAASPKIIVLCYHNVEDDPRDPEVMSVKTEEFIKQLNWLKHHGYTPISIEDLLAAKKGLKPLPRKPVILTFDDGYKSFYTRVFPILKAYRYPAVLAIVGKWMEADENSTFLYGNKIKPRSMLLSWSELKEIADSGLVEIASHSYDLHKGVLANPQGNLEPAATFRIYDPKTKRYEEEEHYLKRIREDLRKNIELLYEKLGVKPRVMVWPYGEYNQLTLRIAKELGMQVAMTLEDGVNELKDIWRMKRILLREDDDTEDFAWMFYHPQKLGEEIERVVHVDLDYVYDPDPKQMHENLSRLLDRIKAYHVTTVYLQAFADPDGDGVAQELYFPNSYLPVRADIFNRVAWQLMTRSKVKVYAWMPVSAFDVDGSEDLFVQKWEDGKSFIDAKRYKRLSVFNEKSREIVKRIYKELAIYAPLNGILFHDDGYLDEDEDFSPSARKAYEQAGFATSSDDIPKSDFKRWTAFKTDALIDFTEELADVVRVYRPSVKTARNLYANVVLDPKSERWFAQNFEKFLQSYDFTAVMAMPFMEGAEDDRAWLHKLAEKVKKIPNGAKKSLFELQSFDWRTGTPVPSKRLKEEMVSLQLDAILNYGYYPDDFLKNHPEKEVLYPEMSRNSYPFVRR
jgi:biofilm PGA synthesis lipoprotein PgaB